MSRPTIYYRISDIDKIGNQHVDLYYPQGDTTPVKAGVAVLQWSRESNSGLPNFESYATINGERVEEEGKVKIIGPMTEGGVAYALTYVLLQEALKNSETPGCTIKSAHGGVLAMSNIEQFKLDGEITYDPMAKADMADLRISTRKDMLGAMDILKAKLDEKYNGIFEFLEMPPEKKEGCTVMTIDLAKGNDTVPTASGLDDLVVALKSMEKRHQTERKALIQKIKVLEKQLRRGQAKSSSSSENEKEIWV